MYRYTRFLTPMAGLWLAGALAPASGCSPTAIPDSAVHPANPQAPAGVVAPEPTDAPGQQAPDAHEPDAAHPHGNEHEGDQHGNEREEHRHDPGHDHGGGHEHRHH